MPFLSFPPKTFVICPSLMVTLMFPKTYGVYVSFPCPPPKTLVIIPLLIVNVVPLLDRVVVLVVPLTVP